MSKKRHTRRERGHGACPWLAYARPAGHAEHDGSKQQLALMEPLEDWTYPTWDFMSFDRRMCAAIHRVLPRGQHPRYARPLSPCERAMVTDHYGEGLADNWVIVSEVSPGIRDRRGIVLPGSDELLTRSVR